MNIRKLAGMAAVVIAFVIAAAAKSEGAFVASDFTLSLEPQEDSILPGDVAHFNVRLTNVSSTAVMFGSNLLTVQAGVAPRINSQGIPDDSPFVEKADFADGLFEAASSGTILSPGTSVAIPFYFVDTSHSIPPETLISVFAAQLGFQNPPFAIAEAPDFVVRTDHGATISIAGTAEVPPDPGSSTIPEPLPIYVFGSAVLSLICWDRRKKLL